MNCMRVMRSGSWQASISTGITVFLSSMATETSSATLGEATERGERMTIMPSQLRTAASTARSQCWLGRMSYWSTQTETPAAIRSSAKRSACLSSARA